MVKQHRGNSYLLPRLEREHPAIYADWKAGKYPTARQALVAAGLKKPAQPLMSLKNAWSKAGPVERADFLAWIGHATTASSPASARPAPHRVVDADGRLTPAVSARIRAIMDRRQLRMGDVMDEMGFTRLDASLGQALAHSSPSRIRPRLSVALEKWLEDNNGVV